jgi:hypothetical protein
MATALTPLVGEPIHSLDVELRPPRSKVPPVSASRLLAEHIEQWRNELLEHFRALQKIADAAKKSRPCPECGQQGVAAAASIEAKLAEMKARLLTSPIVGNSEPGPLQMDLERYPVAIRSALVAAITAATDWDRAQE